MSRLDLVIFGATGFTGAKAVEEAVRLSKKSPFTWGVAGRSESKLNALLKQVELKTGADLSNTRKIVAEVSEYPSLKAMCAQARVLVNCCGPYRMYGEPVVKACLDEGTHHVDVCGEPQFIEQMQLKYDQKAREIGVYIISACGFDSIPNDMGVVFMQQNFGGTLNSVESYMGVHVPTSHRALGGLHYGTWQSLILGLAHWKELAPLRKQLYPQRLPPLHPKLLPKPVLHRREGRWCVPFPGADVSVVYRTQRYRNDSRGGRPAQFRPYIKVGGLCIAVLTLLGAGLLYLMTLFAFTRTLLLTYPRLFSFGMVSHEGPSEDLMNNTKFRFTLYGEGWDSGVKDIESAPPNKKMTVSVTGVNPGYGATVTALLFSALTIINEKDKMPSTGGVLTTGSAFYQTDLIKNLNENNLIFKVVSTD